MKIFKIVSIIFWTVIVVFIIAAVAVAILIGDRDLKGGER